MLPLTAVPALLAGAAVKGAVLVLAVAAIIVIFRVRSATSRHAFWTAVVLAHLAIPALVLMVPGWNVRVPSRMASLLSAIDKRTFGDARRPVMHAQEFPMAFGGGHAVYAGPRSAVAPTRTPRARTYVYVPGTDVAPRPARRSRAEPRIVIDVGDAPMATAIASAGGSGGGGEFDVQWTPRSRADWIGPTLLIIWFAGALAVLVRLAVGTTRVAVLARDATRVVDGEWLSVLHWLAREVGITRPMTLMRGNELVVPVTWGVIYPKILLPLDADEWTAERRRHVLLHELAHVRRFDALTQLLAQFALALFWFDPFLWYAVHRMRIEREHACDDLVIRHGALPSRYAGDLLDLVQTIGVTRSESVPAFAALAMARRHDFEGRMLSILDPDPDRRPFTLRRALSIAAVAILLVVPLAAMRPYQSSRSADFAMAVRVPATGEAFGIGGGVGSGVGRVDVAFPSTDELPAMPEMPEMPAIETMPAIAAAEMASAPAPALAAAAVALPATEDCEFSESTGSQTSIHSNSDDQDSQKLQYLNRDRRHCALATLEGRAEFSEDDSEIVSLSRGGRATFEERTRDGLWRSLTISERGGGLERTYLENGEAAAFDMEARAWMHAMVQEVVRETGYHAAARVDRIRNQGGVPAVLAEISRIHSSSAKRAYYSALLDGDRLSDRDLEATVRQAGRELESSGDLSAIISKVPVSSTRSGTREALADALEHIESDGDKSNTILRLVRDDADRDLVLVALRAARTIESDGDASRVLIQLAPLALAKGDDSLRAEFFRAVRTIESDGDTRRVLSVAIKEGRASSELALDLIHTARRIESDGDKSAVLTEIASANLVNGKELTQEYLDAARSIESDGDYRRAMEAMRGKP